MEQTSTRSRADLYREISDHIIEQIEAGTGSYRMPWHHDGLPTNRPMNAISHAPYRGINVFILWAAAQRTNYPTGLWATYRQWHDVGIPVRAGERGTLAVFWKKLRAPAPPCMEDDATSGPLFVARRFWLFNAEQVEGYIAPRLPRLDERRRIAEAEQFIRHLEIETRFGGNNACYVPAGDYVRMPPFHQFRNAVAFYAVHLHECAHATGAPHRLDRGLAARFGSEAYAMEEMIAEWASCLACMSLELSSEPRPDHAPYIASWLKVLKEDRRAVFTAASQAQRIVDWMWSRQPIAMPADDVR